MHCCRAEEQLHLAHTNRLSCRTNGTCRQVLTRSSARSACGTGIMENCGEPSNI